ncbi:Alkaline phosphatase-like, alpha/beta/alpha [Ascosphaera apis ARSEF 7405]|uniref:Alkaline phosphatase-like, alpha/beta/alpha n=1 Tax=Ascosphaera apis ARSEF 7405 TaxID=392613 RepID=A0A162IDM4_9EURO|nr:Alkaline phosphatase-like, alpha/beta/alpha [Ascosphaera apis ARSEF 7405]
MNPDTRTPTGPSAGGRKNKSSTQQQQQQQQQSQLRTPTTTPSEYKKIKAQWAAAQALLEKEKLDAARKKSGDADDGKGKGASERELLRAVKERDVAKNVVEENEFKRWHGGIMGVLGWFLFIHLVGIYFFTKGFLLTRLVLDNKSSCDVLPFEDGDYNITSPIAGASRSPKKGCWHPKTFDKAVVVVIDALRYDFVVPSSVNPAVADTLPSLYHDNFPILYDSAVSSPQNAFLLPFIADPPTTTLQRLKGLTTGTLPTFIDAGSNFAGMTIEEDNLVSQLISAGKKVVHLGDDTWEALFPNTFDKNLSRPFDSFNVWDLHTVDNGVINNLMPLLHPKNSTQWDVVFAHLLGVDHAGHRYGPHHTAMAAKLKQMNALIEDIMSRIDDNTLLVVLGDHGMDSKGDHGGESDDEIEASLWMYSKKPAFARTDPAFKTPPATAKDAEAVPQIDLVPTLALLLGLPVPFNNLGAPIEHAFAGHSSRKVDWQNLIDVNRVTAAQIRRYQQEYAEMRWLDDDRRLLSSPLEKFDAAEKAFSNMGVRTSVHKEVYQSYRDYERNVLGVCKALWARFDVTSMQLGVGLLVAGVIVLYAYARTSAQSEAKAGERTEISFSVLKYAGIGAVAGAVDGGILMALGVISDGVQPGDTLLFCAAALSILTASIRIWKFARPQLSLPVPPRSIWTICAVVITVLPSIGFASNSYTIWEDRISLFFLTTFGVLAACSSLRQPRRDDRVLGLYHSCLFIVLGRVASFSKLCREEQMPYCKSTYYASSASSTSAPWQLLIPFVLALILPSVIKSYYHGTLSYEGSAIFWIGIAFRIGIALTGVYWYLDANDDNASTWLDAAAALDDTPSVITSDSMKTVRVVIAQIVLAIAFAAGTTTFAWAKPCISIGMTPGSEIGDDGTAVAGAGSSPAKKTTVTILGFANVYGTRYFILVVNFALAIILLQKPMGAGAIGLQIWQILSLLEILDTNGLTTSNSPIGPVILGLLGRSITSRQDIRLR